MTDTEQKIRQALADPDAPWYGSNLVSWVGDLLDEIERLRHALAVELGQDKPRDSDWDCWLDKQGAAEIKRLRTQLERGKAHARERVSLVEENKRLRAALEQVRDRVPLYWAVGVGGKDKNEEIERLRKMLDESERLRESNADYAARLLCQKNAEIKRLRDELSESRKAARYLYQILPPQVQVDGVQLNWHFVQRQWPWLLEVEAAAAMEENDEQS